MICVDNLHIEFLFRSPEDRIAAPECFEKDNIPVDTEEICENHCEDIHGGKYEENSTISSCCGCLM